MNEGGETVYYDPQDHPWLEMPVEDSVNEEILYSPKYSMRNLYALRRESSCGN